MGWKQNLLLAIGCLAIGYLAGSELNRAQPCVRSALMSNELCVNRQPPPARRAFRSPPSPAPTGEPAHVVDIQDDERNKALLSSAIAPVSPTAAVEGQQAIHPAADPLVVTPVRRRWHIAPFLNTEGLKTGAELGVQKGRFAEQILTWWPNCTSYLLVDLWKPQDNYVDSANVGQSEQEKNYQETLVRLKPWEQKLKVCRNFTTVCAKLIPDESLDFVYVDARHDFKGVYEDIAAWWPKLRKNGVMGGHDYVTQSEVGREQDWTLNYDGTRDETGEVVLGAVNKFFMEGTPQTNPHYRQLAVSYRDTYTFPSWFVRR